MKNAWNIAERGLPFERVADLDWDTAVSKEDRRKDYGELRMRVVGLIGQRVYVAIVTARGDATHVISFRKANKKEVKQYEQEKR